MTRRLLVLFLLLASHFVRADVIISEFLANNDAGLTDEDGSHSDWIEIYNSGPANVNLLNWRLTDDPVDLAKWVFPSIDLPPNGFLIVFASNKNRANAGSNLHTNFRLSAGGGYLALVKPDLSFASVFDPYPAQYPDKPYGYAQTVNTTTYLTTNAPLKWRVPTDNSLPAATWTARTYNDAVAGWTSGTNAAGFETTVSGWQLRTVFANTNNVSSAALAETVLATPSQQASSSTVTHPVINWNNNSSPGNYATENPPPALNFGTDLDYYVVEGTGIITIPTAGAWTFCITSDDGCLLQIRPISGTYTTVIGDPGTRGMANSVGTYTFPTAGDYEIRALIYENTGGSGGEVCARLGSVGGWDSTFRLIGDTTAGGLAIRSTPAGGSGTGGYASLLGTNLLASMFNANPKQSSVFLRYSFNIANPATVNTLTMPIQYDDGFVAYLNGTEVGRRNAPAGTLNFNAVASSDRLNSNVLLGESLDLTPFKNQLVAGNNVLAIHGLNSAASNGDLLMRPQLAQYSSTLGALSYFNTATPGAFNTATVYNRVAPVTASVDHGFYTTAQSVVLTCTTPGATIYYTYDGSFPSATNPAAASGTSPVTLSINTTRVVRAMGVKAGSTNGDILTRTYLFLANVLTQSPTGTPPVISNPAGAAQATTVWPSGPINSQILDYGMDPDIVNNPSYSGTLVNDLKTIPTMSIVTDKEYFFNPSYGIYVNPRSDGNDPDPNNPDTVKNPNNWERQSSIELINPDGSTGFQANCGVRIRGGFSRDPNNPKHGLRIFFRDDYGTGKLKYDLHKNAPFGSGGAKEFTKFDLRCSNNYSWSYQGDASGVFVQDPVNRDMQLAMGQPSSHGSFYHLYINGQYWGLYNIDERPEANFGESYFGGIANDYDTVKIDTDTGYNLEATDGNTAAWNAFWVLADQTLPAAGTEQARNAVYQRMKGNNPDGTPNPAYPVYLDDVNAIVECLIIYYGGNLDAAISNFLNNESPNNVFSIRNRLGVSGGWKNILHDSEHTLLDVNVDRTGPWPAGNSAIQGGNAFNKSTIQYIFQQLVANSTDFRALFADQVYRHMTNGGALTPSGALALFDARTAEIDRAVVPESARWGDAKVATPLNRSNWLNAVTNTRNNFFPGRTNVVLGQFRTRGWYPTFDPPIWSLRGGTVAPGSTITLTLPANAPGGSVIYYTLDGTDPRALGGGLSATAIQYSGPISIPFSKFIRTRVKSATDWSAIDQAAFYTTQTYTGLAITEINFHPPASSVGGTDASEFEFIEFKNTGANTLDLGGLNFTAGLTYTFPPGISLAPGQFFLLLHNQAKFASRYPGVSLAPGTFGVVTSGSLDNSGETLTIATVSGTPVLSMTYDDSVPWPVAADGVGFTIVPRGTVYNSSVGTDWRASANLYGSPRADDPAVSISPILVNEILTNSGAGQKDSIELYNPTASAVSVADWWLTDDAHAPQKYRIPAGTVIPAGGYVSFNEDQFNVGATAFAFNSAGDDAYVFSGNAAGNLTGYSHGVGFAGGELNRSFGRYVNSVGDEQYPRQSANTFGTANAGPLVGPLVISEIMYNPVVGYDEYIEIRNISGNAVPLYDPANPANVWKVGGVGYSFPTAQTIPAGGAALVVGIDPATFRTKYGISAAVPIYGPFTGTLQDNGERISLEMPDTPILDGQGLTVIPYDVIDSVRYSNQGPWPNAANGTGPSLQRTNNAVYGDDPNNWFADGVTPGAVNSTNTLPTVTLNTPANGAVFNSPVFMSFSASATDPDGSVLKVEYYIDGVKVGESTSGPNYSFIWSATVGIHTVTAKALDNSLGSGTSAPRTIYVQQTVAQGLKAEYFANNALSGVPTGIRTEGPIDFSDNVNSWPTAYGFPGVSSDQFSVRWSGQIRATATGAHIFQISSDEGARLYVNGQLVVNNWTAHTNTNPVSGVISLTSGQLYDIVLEYYDLTGLGLIQLRYTSPGSSLAFVPVSVLYPDGAPIIVTQPVAITREQGTSATFSVVSSGKNLAYQWRKNGTAIPGATAASFTLPYPLVTDAGNYSVLITNPSGFAISTAVALTVTFTDSDGDGIQDAWETANGLSSSNAADALLDLDGDGFNNKEEFLAGTDPRNSQSRPGLTITKVSGGPGFTLTFTAQPYKSYTIQARESLTTGSWTTIQTVAPVSTVQPMTYTDPTTLPVRHYRVATP